MWFITLGQSGITDVRMEHCTIWAEYCEVIFHMVGDKTHAVVDNCDITLNQPDDVAGHDIRKSANPMLAQGNGRADGSTVIQNSRIVLSGDDGRRISYRLSALKDNTLEVSLGLRHRQHAARSAAIPSGAGYSIRSLRTAPTCENNQCRMCGDSRFRDEPLIKKEVLS